MSERGLTSHPTHTG